jgi:hypothetical protein
MAIQDNISDAYLAQYNLDLGVSAVQKINSFAFIQQLTYNGILNSLVNNFLSLEDWQAQIAAYSAAYSPLTSSYTAIKKEVPLNELITEDSIVNIDGLGQVGNLFETIQCYNKVFTLSDDELTDPSTINQKSENFS